MQRLDAYAFYDLGMRIHALEKVVKDQVMRDAFFDLWNARGAVETIINGQVLPVDVCLPACGRLRSAITAIIPEDITKLPTEKFDENITEYQGWHLSQCLKEFETVFAAELQASDVYFVSQKEAYDTSDLIEFADKIFPEEIRKTFTPRTIADVRQAGRCLAFNLPTAAGFHITRAMENVTLEASQKVPGAKPSKNDLHGYIRILENAGVHAEVIKELDRLRNDYRNQLMHPEIFLSDIQISVLLSDVKNVMVRLHVAMQNLAFVANLAEIAMKPVPVQQA
jgi:hypothetical protein